METTLRVVEFQVGESWCALPVEDIHEILSPPEIEAMSALPDWQMGTAEIRGKKAMIWNAALLTGTPSNDAGQGRILMLTDVIGIWVDAVNGIAVYPAETIQKMKTPGTEKSEIQVLHTGTKALWLMSKQELFQMAEARLAIL